MNNSLKLITNNALKSLKNYNPIYDEQWKYTNIKNFSKFNLSSQKLYNKVDKKYADTDSIVIINNVLQNEQKLSPQINISSLKHAIKHNLNNCRSIFNQIIPNEKNKFILYNTAYFQTGNYFYFKQNSKIDEPIYINNIIEQTDSKSFFNNRFLFHFDKNCSAKIILTELNTSKISSNIIYELYLEKNSNIEFIIESNKPETTQILNFGSTINQDAMLKIFPIDISGKMIKNNYFINLKGKNSQCYYNGLNLLNGTNHIDNYIEINHNNKYTISHANHKNILNEKSSGVFYSKSTINKNSSNSEAHQKNNNLILSEKSMVHSNPQLMIYNNDVQCSHGSTTGEIDDEALFYLRSRGINLENAKIMLMHAFLNEIVNSLDNKNIKNDIQKKINSWIKNTYVNK